MAGKIRDFLINSSDSQYTGKSAFFSNFFVFLFFIKLPLSTKIPSLELNDTRISLPGPVFKRSK